MLSACSTEFTEKKINLNEKFRVQVQFYVAAICVIKRAESYWDWIFDEMEQATTNK